MDNTSKKIILLLMIVVVIIIILICILGLHSVKGNLGYVVEQQNTDLIELLPKSEVSVVESRENFYTIQECVNKYYTYQYKAFNSQSYSEQEASNIEHTKLEFKGKLYDLLDKEYIEYKNITKTNLETKLNQIGEPVINITDMYVSEPNSQKAIYIVYGTVRNKNTNEISKFRMIVKLDLENITFSILPSEFVEEKYAKIEINEELRLDFSENINKNDNNKCQFKRANDNIYALDLLNHCKEQLLYNKEEAYYNLDEKYKNKKFASISDFENYANNKYKKLENITSDKYQKINQDNYTQYIIIDKSGNYYIFKETAPMKYTIILDTYTIDIPEFTEKYKVSKDQEKVILNLNKFMLALNDGDYKYAYSVLADSFKKNNFPTYASFENYAKTNFFKENKFEYSKFGDEAGTYYTYTVNITDTSKQVSNKITKTFIMLLEEGTDFKISFNV